MKTIQLLWIFSSNGYRFVDVKYYYMIAGIVIVSLFLILVLYYYIQDLIRHKITNKTVDYLKWDKKKISAANIKVVNADYYEENDGVGSTASFWMMAAGKEARGNRRMTQTYLTTKIGEKTFQSRPIKIDSGRVEVLLKLKGEIILFYKDEDNYYFEVDFLYN